MKALSLLSLVAVATRTVVRAENVSQVCNEIAGAVSNASAVFFPSDSEYAVDIEHYATSSAQNSTCSVEPGTTEDVGRILQIIGKTRTPFAVKSGGHIMNPDFSSTTGVHISLTRFNDVEYDASSETAQIGTGLIWDEVYARLETFGVVVPGGRVSGIGVGGFALGGGFNWLTNQHGLTIDLIRAIELVLPNGTATTITSSSYPDLFFGLRGGHNNFGIVTRITFQAIQQGSVWGGFVTYPANETAAFINATADFSLHNTDPKAQIIPSIGSANGSVSNALQLFYDGPEPPAGVFDKFLAIEPATADVSTRSFLSFVQSSPINMTVGFRGRYTTVSLVQFTPAVLDVIVNELNTRSATLAQSNQPFFLIAYSIEPFSNDIFTFGNDTAYPPDRSRALLPFNINYSWVTSDADDLFVKEIEESSKVILDAADAEGQNVGNASLYPNYAISSTPIERIYGDNLPRLKEIKAKYDPDNVMGLAGGWKF